MARILKPEHSYHLVRLRCDYPQLGGDGELLLIGGCKPYIWAGRKHPFDPVTFSGRNALRQLAHEILKVTAPKKKRKQDV